MITTVVYTLDMKTVLTIKVDKEEKDKAKEIAAQMGVPLSTVINAQLREFVRTREFSVSLEPLIKPEIEKELLKRSRQYHANKNIAHRISSVADAREMLL